MASEPGTEDERQPGQGMLGKGHQAESRKGERTWSRHGRKGQWLQLEWGRQGELARTTQERLQGPGQTMQSLLGSW